MRICNLATAIILFTGFAYAKREKSDLVDISQLWDEFNEEDYIQEVKDDLVSANADLYAKYWGYIEEVVAIVDAAIDEKDLYESEFYDIEDFFKSLDKEEL